MDKLLWSTKDSDKVYNRIIKERDGWRCAFCGKTKADGITVQTCHYWSKNVSAVRYDTDDAVCGCRGCHFKTEREKQGQFRDLMLARLGRKKYNALRKKYERAGVTRKEAIAQFMSIYEGGLAPDDIPTPKRPKRGKKKASRSPERAAEALPEEKP